MLKTTSEIECDDVQEIKNCLIVSIMYEGLSVNVYYLIL
jgi:hypothetical protein